VIITRSVLDEGPGRRRNETEPVHLIVCRGNGYPGRRKSGNP
jgi:hypothetical protein